MEENPSNDLAVNTASICDIDKKSSAATSTGKEEQDKENLFSTLNTEKKENTQNKDLTCDIAKSCNISVDSDENSKDVSESESVESSLKIEVEGNGKDKHGKETVSDMKRAKKRRKNKAYKERFKKRKRESKTTGGSGTQIEGRKLPSVDNLDDQPTRQTRQLELGTNRVTLAEDSQISGKCSLNSIVGMGNTRALTGRREMQVAVIPTGYTELSNQADAKEIRKALTEELRKTVCDTSSPELHFDTSEWMQPGWLVVTCSDETSQDWLLNLKLEEITGKSVLIQKVTELDELQKIAILLDIQDNEKENVLQVLQGQNRKLQVMHWKSLGVRKVNDQFLFTFAIDSDSKTVLNENGWKLFFGLSSLSVHQFEYGAAFAPTLNINSAEKNSH